MILYFEEVNQLVQVKKINAQVLKCSNLKSDQLINEKDIYIGKLK